MKTDTDYSFVYKCPTTNEPLSRREIMYSSGICPRCGHNARSTITHEKKIVGRWRRPNIIEWVMGKRKEFLLKEEEDEIMAKLKGEFTGDQQESAEDDMDYQHDSTVKRLIDGE